MNDSNDIPTLRAKAAAGAPDDLYRLATALVVSVAWNFPMHRAFVFAASSDASEPEAEGERPAHLEARARP